MEAVGVEGRRELFYTDEWLPKLVERLTIVLECLKNKTEILESDYEVAEEAHRLWFEGRLNWSKSVLPEAEVKATEVGLFDNIEPVVTDSFDDARDKLLDGTVVVNTDSEPKTEEQ